MMTCVRPRSCGKPALPSPRISERLTIERYDAIRAALDPSLPLMPVLQGALPEHYVDHLRTYGDRLTFGMWVGVGSVCKRNGYPHEIAAVLRAIKADSPDLRLHGFGCKLTALSSAEVRAALHSADSLAWSYAARKQGRNPNDWRECGRELITTRDEYVQKNTHFYSYCCGNKLCEIRYSSAPPIQLESCAATTSCRCQCLRCSTIEARCTAFSSDLWFLIKVYYCPRERII